MGQRSILSFCERCGQRFELQQPAPGERDLGLDVTKTTFRYCTSCQLFVGRACCWNPDAVACIIDAPPSALIAVRLLGTAPDESSNEAAARRGLEESAASIEALEQFEWAAALAPRSDTDREAARRAWDDAWWSIGWLIARVETSRDAAAKAIWRTSAQPGAPSAEDLNGALAALDRRYGRARAVTEARLHVAAESLAPTRRRQWLPAPLRRVAPAVTVGVLTGVAALTFSMAALLQLGYLNAFTSNASAVASQREGAVLGGGASAVPSSSADSTPAPFAPQAVIARFDFDELRIGLLAGASDEIDSVTGAAEVVAFPSPFDRSIRVLGNGSHRFCVPSAELDEGGISFEMDLYAKAAFTAGRLRLSFAPTSTGATVVSVPLQRLRSLRPEAWHHLRALSMPRQPVAISIGETAQGQPHRLTVPLVHDARAVPGTVCIAVSGMAQDAELLIDNLQVQQ